jgi:acyl-coenzyme A thioesterase PaaI-like protein
MPLPEIKNLMDSKVLRKLRPSTTVPTPGSHVNCMVCGRYDSLGLRFRTKGNSVEALFQADPKWQGYQGVLHGGMISTLLDAAMTHCLFDHGIEAMTADLKIRFLKPAPCTEFLLLRAHLLSERRHLYQLSAELICAGELIARAEARFMRRKSG